MNEDMSSRPHKSRGQKNSVAPEQDGAGSENEAAAGRRPARRMGDVREVERSSMTWLISFTDVMALMLTFFVLLFSMTEPGKQEWTNISSALQSEFNRFYGALHSRSVEDAVSIDRINFNQALNLPYLSAVLRTAMAANDLLENAQLIRQEEGLIISLPEELLFDPGSAQVKSQGRRALYALGGTLSRVRNKVEIIGHTDPRPITTETAEGHGSNWELSLARAANVAAALENVGYQHRITIHGQASGRYDDLRDVVEDDQQRLDLSRRVDIVLLAHDGSRQKVFSNLGAE